MKFSKKNKVYVFDWLNLTSRHDTQFHFGYLDQIIFEDQGIKTFKAKKIIIHKIKEMADYFNCEPIEIGPSMKDNNWRFSIGVANKIYRSCLFSDIKASYLIESEEDNLLVLDSPLMIYYEIETK